MAHHEIQTLTENGLIFLLIAATIGLLRISVDFIIESTRSVTKAVAKEKKNKKLKKILTPSQLEDVEKQSETESASDEDESLGSNFHSSVARMSSAMHAVIFVYATVVMCLRVPMADALGEKEQYFYSSFFGFIALLMASGLFQHYRDWERRRFGLLQRILNVVAALFFLGGCIVAPMGGEHEVHSMKQLYYPKEFIGKFNIYLAIAFTILTFMEWFAFPFYVRKARRKKARLSRKAMISM